MNVSLHDIQADIQRLAQQQTQNQAQQLQAQQLMQAQQIANLLNQVSGHWVHACQSFPDLSFLPAHACRPCVCLRLLARFGNCDPQHSMALSRTYRPFRAPRTRIDRPCSTPP